MYEKGTTIEHLECYYKSLKAATNKKALLPDPDKCILGSKQYIDDVIASKDFSRSIEEFKLDTLQEKLLLNKR